MLAVLGLRHFFDQISVIVYRSKVICARICLLFANVARQMTPARVTRAIARSAFAARSMHRTYARQSPVNRPAAALLARPRARSANSNHGKCYGGHVNQRGIARRRAQHRRRRKRCLQRVACECSMDVQPVLTEFESHGQASFTCPR
jgi:hypothetical protein